MKTREHIIEFIKKQKVSFIASVNEEGFPNIKAMLTPRKIEGVMLTGIMEVLQDAETKQEIWRTGDTIFYKQGVTDPDYCVLKFTAIKGRHYCDLKTESFDIEDLK